MPYLIEPAVNPTRLNGSQPDIVAGELTLRRWVPEDAEQLMSAYDDPEIRRWNLRRLDSRREAETLIATWKQGWRRQTAVSWAVVRTSNPDKILGQVGCRSLFLVDGVAEISYWIMPGQRGRGIATRATKVLSQWALETVGLHRLELVHSVFNTGSCQVAIKAGFEIEGVKRELQRHADGSWHDMCLHSRIRPPYSPPSARPRPPRRQLVTRLRQSVRPRALAAGRSLGEQGRATKAARG
ncbi:MAG TPA: GNAT family N-acetyltransferase [Mycobacteriales bacterium]|jgi:RimJ/RimL family protein N-acetyltransferase|nr:GNAT family N-acetyltransferase [Mycobacteriales bacterium]